MKTHADKTQENKSQSVAAGLTQKQGDSESTFQFMDNRPETIAQRKLQERANNSPQVKQLKSFQDKANDNPQVKDGQTLQGKFVVQLGKKKEGKRASKKDAPAREGAREARYAAKQAGATTFNNNEKRLPQAPKGTRYIETDVGAGRTDRGRRRVVSLIEEGSGRTLKQYNTDDHYSSFN